MLNSSCLSSLYRKQSRRMCSTDSVGQLQKQPWVPLCYYGIFELHLLEEGHCSQGILRKGIFGRAFTEILLNRSEYSDHSGRATLERAQKAGISGRTGRASCMNLNLSKYLIFCNPTSYIVNQNLTHIIQLLYTVRKNYNSKVLYLPISLHIIIFCREA